MLKPKNLLNVLAVLLMAAAVVLVNLGIMYSSVPHYEQMGWAIFCCFNALWIFVLGLGSAVYAGSDTVNFNQLDADQRIRERIARES